ncbi:MAG TPA: hypothetical protein VFZ23_09120 [Pyrinomonadaceae bacterium]
MTKQVILTISVTLIALLATTSDTQAQRGAFAQAQRITGDRFAFSGRTPRGANIYSVRQPSQPMLSAIDRGLGDLFAVARKNGYGRRLNYSDYTIYIANADRTRDSSGRYSPDIAVGAAQYAGTDYDQGGFVYAAGMVIGYNPMSFVIAEHAQDLNRVSEVVRYEGEHLVLYHNDRRRYSQTADHSRGGGHPILQ